ncbi:MAG: DUF1127 domain-containing protein [Tabrizicola sp.]
MSSRRLALPLASHFHLFVASVSRFPARLIQLAALTRSRRSLSRLDDHLLRDIGLTCAQAQAEAERRGWDAPLHWKG